MKIKYDLTTFLNQTLFSLDIHTMLNDVEDFLIFSERNLDRQKKREFRSAVSKMDEEQFDDTRIAAQLQNQAREGVEYRFGVILKQRVRYAALTALITTVEWCLISLKKRASFDFPNNDVNENEAVYILKVFNNKMKLELESKVLLIQKLIQVRNCIVHGNPPRKRLHL